MCSPNSMGSRKTKIVPPIRHALDINALRQMRDAVNSLLNSRVVVGTTAQSHHSDSNVVYEIPNSTNVVASYSFYNPKTAYQAGATVQVQTQQIVRGITLVPGTYGCITNLPTVLTDPNTVPQYPYPTTGVIYWMLIALGITPVNVCSAGNKQIYINSSAPF